MALTSQKFGKNTFKLNLALKVKTNEYQNQ